MCGFVAVFTKTPTGDPGEAGLQRMDAALVHRGPDEQGRYRDGLIAMAHRRLSIIDLGGGRQPMASADGRVRIVFNGEIYNYRDILAKLRGLGSTIKGASDTEVLLAAYMEWGDGCLAELNGMFAFVIYDARDNSVFAARDRFGEKPFYIHDTKESIAFASELKALVRGGRVDTTIDKIALYSFFTTGYVQGPATIFKSVRRLGPGRALRYAGGQLREWQYWAPPTPSSEVTDLSTALDGLPELLADSVRLRMVADVPVGFFLSGGVDSSAIVALASRDATHRLETFSIGFDEPKYDEREYARFVSGQFGTHHHEFVLRPQGLDIINELAWHLDEPFADASALPTWFLSRETRQHVKVALSGDGGDEMFAGYDVYRGHVLSERLRAIPPPLRHLCVGVLRRLPASNPDSRAAFERLARNIADIDLEPGQRFVAKQQIFRRSFLADLAPLLRGVATAGTDRVLFASLFDSALEPLAAIAQWQQTVSLVDDMLVKVDRMSMAHSLEVRAPFLDHRIAEFTNRVSFSVKLPGGRTKYLLKHLLGRYFSEEFLWRRKQGFVVPLNHWFKDTFDDYLKQKLLAPGSIVSHVFRRDAIEQLVVEHATLARDRSRQLWALLMFEVWCDMYEIGEEALIDA